MQYLLPLTILDSSYGLLVVNRMRRRVVVLDPSRDVGQVGESTHNKEMMKEITLLKQEFNDVLQARIPCWNTPLMDWRHSMSSNARR